MVDWVAVWYLLESFVDREETQIIFFDYKLQRRVAKAAVAAGIPQERVDEVLQWPVGAKSSRARVKHEPGHTHHIHVRFHCGPYETECAER